MSASGQSQPNSQENKRPTADSPPSSGPAPAQQSSAIEDDDDDFVDISDEDTDMRDADADDKQRTQSALDLHRLTANSDDNEDDSDDESDNMASHPLLSMLTGRLGPRRRGSTHKWDSLHPVTSVLSVHNVDDCTELENEAFPENERCSREKVSTTWEHLDFCAILRVRTSHGTPVGDCSCRLRGHVPIVLAITNTSSSSNTD
jgi:hypothetical protein